MGPALAPDERLVDFRATLPADARHLCWLPHQVVTLTLPDQEGRSTAFQVWRCPQQGLEVCHIKYYGVLPCATPP